MTSDVAPPGEAPTMSPLDRQALADHIRATTDRLRERQAEQLAHWTDAYVALGRALEAAEHGEVVDVGLALESASDVEYDLLGDCNVTGRAIGFLNEQAKGGEPTD